MIDETVVANVAAAYVRNHQIPISELPALFRAIRSGLDTAATEERMDQKPAVPVKKSVTDDYVVCLEDGKRLKMLKRYLRSNYGMTPEEYRAKWGLPADYPMTAPNYAKQRSDFAKQSGLGKSGRGR